MRYRDAPTVEVSEKLGDVEPRSVWEIVTDIALPTHTDGELVGVEWVGPAQQIAVGARFLGTNSSELRGTWTVECEIVEVEPERRFVWTAGSATTGPWATWAFEIDPTPRGVVVRQWARLGPGSSPLAEIIATRPDREAQIIARRMGDWRASMQANLDLVKQRLAVDTPHVG
ncbi:SRPBCC family protein [Gordonia sp. ABSL1-1]|uniref:SRPBCC family protein n=1 Tax=Gordonia sp. ABSL1-1 TaxID=3053923 RepID=UPI0025742626|nr:SRPBCC family protein [Gordonia sp. ABSL1-1]MDL9938039.1 SRPBCC family protein [Gordonia sp. ABSL1-1]